MPIITGSTVLAEFEKVRSINTLWLWTLADSICGAAVMAVRLPNGFGPSLPGRY